VFPNQRSLDEQGRAGLEEERRLAHVGITRGRKRVKIFFATNRRTHGLWQTNIPSRFLEELPPASIAIEESKAGFGTSGHFGGPFGASRFDQADAFGSNYGTPGWQRAQKRRGGFSENAQSDLDDDTDANVSSPPPLRGRSPAEAQGAKAWREGGGFARNAKRRHGPLTVEGELVAKSTGTTSAFAPGDRVFHQKFGNGNVVAVDGNKLTIAFDKAGEKRVVDSFVERV
jgi:DNA helicase-2/ATP-dependent DNA helicase PcrA